MQQGVNPSRTKSLPLKANVDLWSYEARKIFLSGNFSGALQLYQRCINYDPCDGRAWLGAARIQWKRGKYDIAEKLYKDGLYYNPNNPYLMQAWAGTLSILNLSYLSHFLLSLFLILICHFSFVLGPVISIAVQLEKSGQYNSAMKLLKLSVKNNPKHAASWVALARLYQRKGVLAEARNCYASAVEGDPKSYVALQAWGVLEAEFGNYEIARDLFQRSISSSKKSGHALQAWANMEMKQGNIEDAKKLLIRALQVWPSSTRARVSLSEVHEMKGEIDIARETYTSGESIASRCGDAGFFQVLTILFCF